MKKVFLLFVLALCSVVVLAESARPWTLSDGVISIEYNHFYDSNGANWSGGNISVITSAISKSGYSVTYSSGKSWKPTIGDEIIFSITGVASYSGQLSACIVDERPEFDYYYECTNSVSTEVIAGEQFTLEGSLRVRSTYVANRCNSGFGSSWNEGGLFLSFSTSTHDTDLPPFEITNASMNVSFNRLNICNVSSPVSEGGTTSIDYDEYYYGEYYYSEYFEECSIEYDFCLKGDVVRISAKSNEDFKFSEWSDGATENPHYVTVSSDIELTAYFVRKAFKVGDIRYNIIEDNKVAVSKIDCAEVIAIPSSVTFEGKKYDVTAIDDRALAGCSSLSSIFIPNSITKIGQDAFSYCYNLTSVLIPNNVVSIGYGAFKGCGKLTSIVIPNNVTTIGESTFSGCTNLASIVIPNNVTAIGESAFSGCTNLKSVVIGEKVESIGGNAFNGCSSLSKITCYPVEPPTVYTSSFSNYNGYLTIPCDNFESYDIHAVWGTFKHVDCLSAESVDIEQDAVVVEPDVVQAAFSMPINEDANSYTLTISNNGQVFCSITFNAQGQLANIDFSTTKSYRLKSDVAAYQFTVTGLSAATDYGYSFKALNKSKAVLKEYSGTFTTKNEDGTGGSVQGGSEGSGQGGQETETAIDGVSNANAVTIVSNQILVNGEAPAFVTTISGKKIANANLKSGVYFVVVDGETVGVSVW